MVTTVGGKRAGRRFLRALLVSPLLVTPLLVTPLLVTPCCSPGDGVADPGGEVRGHVLLSDADVHASVQLGQPDHPVRPLHVHVGHQEHRLHGQVLCPVARYV